MSIIRPCPLCRTDLGEGDAFSSAKMRNGPNQYMFQIFCPNCKVHLIRRSQGKNQTAWLLPEIEPSEVVRIVDEETMTAIEKKFQNYPKMREKFQKYILDVYKEGDLMGLTESGVFVLVRKERVIAAKHLFFKIPGLKPGLPFFDFYLNSD